MTIIPMGHKPIGRFLVLGLFSAFNLNTENPIYY
jgi:hypothetical protein